MLVIPASIFIIFGLLFATFGSVPHALLILWNVPFAMVGGILALWARAMPLNLSASVGFIALFDVAVLNGIVLVSAINRLRESGKPDRVAILEGAASRLRPVLMTALVASLGFIRMALATTTGAEVQRPLSPVVIGGLSASTLLTLFLLPLLYLWFSAAAAITEFDIFCLPWVRWESEVEAIPMNVSLTSELEKLVADKVHSGMYQTSSEVIREGLRLLKERDDRLESLRRNIHAGFEAVDRGEFTDYDPSSIRQLADRVKTRGRRLMAGTRPKAPVR